MKKFTIEIVFDENDGMIHTNVTNDGFNAMELLGLLEMKKMDIIDQCLYPEKFKHTRKFKADNEWYEVTKEGE